jgi:hypothetical protein
LTGGPGASNMKFKPPVALLVNHDFVMVGYRIALNQRLFRDHPVDHRAS